MMERMNGDSAPTLPRPGGDAEDMADAAGAEPPRPARPKARPKAKPRAPKKPAAKSRAARKPKAGSKAKPKAKAGKARRAARKRR